MKNYLMQGGDFHKYDHIKSIKIWGDHPKSATYTIMIPTYKRPHFLVQSLKSALNQKDYKDYEVVVVDNDADGEKEKETLEVIQGFSSERVVYYKNEQNIGIYGNTLRAAQLARGKYVVLLNDDDLLHPCYLKTVNAFIKKYNYKGIVGSQPYEFSKDDFAFPELEEKTYAFTVSKREFFFGCCVTSPGLMFPKAIIEEIYNAHEDLLMGDQIIQYKGLTKYGLTFINYPIAAYRISDNETLKSNVLTDMIIHMCGFRKETAQDDWLLKLFMKIFEKEYFYWYMDSSLSFWKKRGLRKKVIDELGLYQTKKWSLKMIILQELIKTIHNSFSKKHG